MKHLIQIILLLFLFSVNTISQKVYKDGA